MANTEKVRLNKYLSETGICSRREADIIIEAGRVTVNGKEAEPGMKVNDLDIIMVDGKKAARREKKVVLAYYKPVGVTCTEKDRHAQVTISDVLDYPVRVTYAGRLDKDSEGLLLMTNDGDLINNLMRAANYHEKEYIVRVEKPLTKEFLKKMSDGVMLKELEVKTRPCFVKEEGKFVFRIILTQGLNRQIRRMCKTLRNEAVSIKRVRVSNILLGDLEPGKYRQVTGSELKELYELVTPKVKNGVKMGDRAGARPTGNGANRGNTAGRTNGAGRGNTAGRANGAGRTDPAAGKAPVKGGLRPDGGRIGARPAAKTGRKDYADKKRQEYKA